MHILVVGGDGFIGRALSAALARSGHTLSLLEHDEQRPLRGGAPQGIVFCQESTGDPDELTRLHVGLTMDLLAELRPARCVYLSTADVYADQALCDELAPLAPRTPLAAIKREAECALATLDGPGGHPIETCILRLGTVYGPSQAGGGLVCRIIRSLLESTPLVGLHPEDRIELIGLEDVVNLIVRLFETDTMPRHLNVGGDAITLGDLAARLASRISAQLKERVTADFDLVPPRPPRVMRLVTDRARALGWTPLTGLEAGLDEVVLNGCRSVIRPIGR